MPTKARSSKRATTKRSKPQPWSKPKPAPASARPKRKYDTSFKPARGEGREYKIRRIPPGLWLIVQRRAAREGVTLRGLILRHLRAWATERPARRAS